jgi:outer membrane protein TolC
MMRIAIGILVTALTPAAASGQGSETLESRLSTLVGRPGGLTADEVARRAEATSFDVRQRYHELQAAAAGVDQALVGYFPRLNLGLRYTRFSPIGIQSLGNSLAAPTVGAGPVPPGSPLVNIPLAFPVFLNQTILQATLTVPISDYILRVSQSHAAATHSEAAAELTLRATRLKIATDARVAYYTWARARLQLVVSGQAVALGKGQLHDARRFFAVGRLSKADVLRTESQLAASELLLERAKNLEAQLEEQMRIAMHDPVRRRYEIGEDLRADLTPLPNVYELDALYAEAFDRRLELRALEGTSQALRDQVRLARAAYYPRLDAVLDATYSNPNPRFIPSRDEFDGSFSAGLALTWSPNDAGTSRAQVRAAQAQLAGVQAQLGALKDAVKSEVIQSLESMREALTSIQTTARGLAAAEESYRARRLLFQNGRATTVEVTDAETELTRARLEAVNARVDLRVARARLLHAIGRDVVAAR